MFSNKCASNFLFTYLVKRIYNNTIKWVINKSRNDEISNSVNICMTSHEAKILRYVAGFIPFSLKKRFENKKDSASRISLEIIALWHMQGDALERPVTFLEYTNSWIDRINRGGLFVVNDEFFVFVRNIEFVARSIFNKQLLEKYSGEDLRDLLQRKFETDENIQSCWESLTKNFQEDAVLTTLKQSIFKKWIDIRARAFANVWIQQLRRKTNDVVGKKSESSLRKRLNNTIKETNVKRKKI